MSRDGMRSDTESRASSKTTVSGATGTVQNNPVSDTPGLKSWIWIP
jgi:hypothetical protein